MMHGQKNIKLYLTVHAAGR